MGFTTCLRFLYLHAMRKTVACFLVLSLISLTASAQKQGNIWYFGDSAGVDFNSGSPVALTDGQTYLHPINNDHNEGTSVICDSSGSLLFYLNGEKVWNKNHQLMPNGNGLLGGLSSTHAAFALPKPGNSNVFYLFTTDAFYPNQLQNGFRYSVIDMCLDNGLGDIELGNKNILLLDTVAEKITVVNHANGIDYWIITHKYWSDAFYSFLLTANGVEDTVISSIGSVHQNGLDSTDTFSAIGQMKASPDGTKIALVFSNTNPAVAELFDFDNTTGVLSNPINLQTDTTSNSNIYGVSFSPDNSKLYISAGGKAKIYQHDLFAGGGVPDSIINSKTLIASLTDGTSHSLQLGPDGKIYAARFGKDFLAVINNPNAVGSACGFQDNAISLNVKFCSLGLPNFIDSYNYGNGLVDCSTGLNESSRESALFFYPNPFYDRTTIEFVISITGQVTLDIYDLMGVKVASLYDNEAQEGRVNKVNFESANLSGGIFFYVLRANEESHIGRMVLMK